MNSNLDNSMMTNQIKQAKQYPLSMQNQFRIGQSELADKPNQTYKSTQI